MSFASSGWHAIFALAVALALAMAPPARAQAPPEAPSTDTSPRLHLSLGGTANVNRTGFHRRWEAGAGAQATLGLAWPEAAAGGVGVEAAGALAYHRYATARDTSAAGLALPQIDAVVTTGRVGAVRPVAARWLTLHAGGLAGLTTMRFAEETRPGRTLETELLVGGYARATAALSPRWGVFVEATAHRTFFAERLDLAYLTAGLRFSRRAPGGLVGFLR